MKFEMSISFVMEFIPNSYIYMMSAAPSRHASTSIQRHALSNKRWCNAMTLHRR